MPQIMKPPSYERDPAFWNDHSECMCGATFPFEEFNENDECPNCVADDAPNGPKQAEQPK